MLDLKQIEEEIRFLERCETTYDNIQKLSWLYTVRDHFVAPDEEIEVAINNERML